MEIVSYLEAVPDTVWAAALASLLTVSGVLLVQRLSARRRLARPAHDFGPRERQMSWQSEVYLQAAEAISRSLSLLVRLVDLDTPDQDFSRQQQSDAATIAKIQVVGGGRTVQAVSAFANEFGSVFLELWLERIRLVDRKNKLELLSGHIHKTSQEQEHYIGLMNQLNLNGNTDKRLWKIIEENVEYERMRFESLTQERQLLWAEQNRDHLAFVKSCFESHTRLAALIPPAIFTVRDELKLPLNKEEYLQSFHETVEKNRIVLDSFLRKIQQVVDV